MACHKTKCGKFGKVKAIGENPRGSSSFKRQVSWKVVTASESGPKEGVVCPHGEDPPVLPVGWAEGAQTKGEARRAE